MANASRSAIILGDDRESHELLITQRDWGLLFGAGFTEGPLFSSAFGVYDNFSVAGGIAKDSRVPRLGKPLFDAARVLVRAIERDADLLRHDYTYSAGGERARHSGAQSVRVRGRDGIISARPKGYCSIQLFDARSKTPRVAEFIDLRIVKTVETEGSGAVRSFRREAEMHWLETLPPWIEFLRPRVGSELMVEHVVARDRWA